ncbi:hypothetical protein MRB53_041506 [Persea americana]|nr:hypothetical protein MRB53_041506 [Persea americana]
MLMWTKVMSRMLEVNKTVDAYPVMDGRMANFPFTTWLVYRCSSHPRLSGLHVLGGAADFTCLIHPTFCAVQMRKMTSDIALLDCIRYIEHLPLVMLHVGLFTVPCSTSAWPDLGIDVRSHHRHSSALMLLPHSP